MSAIRTDWQDDFPNTVIDRKLGDATSHWCYQKAKSGDTLSAYILAKELISQNAITQLKDLLKPNIILVPILAQEMIGLNKIPLATAYVLSEHFNLMVETEILQAEKVSRTSGNGWHRLALTGKQYSSQLKLSQETMMNLRTHYATLEPFWQQTFGYGFACFTESEARFILNSRKNIEQVRTIILEARNAGLTQTITNT